jgi:photosystem II stability/assembly factor-like uncharacterized protein
MIKIKISFLTWLLISFTSNSFSQSGWQIQYYNSSEFLSDIYFINGFTGWAVQSWFDGKISKTTNKGLNWITITTQQFQFGNGVTFYDQSTGWICTSSGNLYRSSDGGYNWTRSNCSNCTTIDDFIDIQFINQFTGWAYGDVNIFKSTDGGLSYNILNCPYHVDNGFFIDSLNGWIGGMFGSAKSTDGGISWFQYSQLNSIWGIYFVNLSKGWVCTYHGKIFKTTNSGVNWIEQYSNNGTPLYKVQFVNENTGWVVGDSGAIIKTTNGGANWYRQSSQPITIYWGIFMISPTEGWVCGDHFILHTTDGGGPIGIQPISNEVPQTFSLSQNYPNPFNPKSKIKFQIAKLSEVKLVIYDVMGREIQILVNEKLSPGTYEAEWDASNFPSGVYFYKLTAGDFSDTKKMVLLK